MNIKMKTDAMMKLIQDRSESNSLFDAFAYSKLLRESFLMDETRPYFHLVIPEGIGFPGDPNAAFYANGRYHLMYLYRDYSNKPSFKMGHVSSMDLVHFRQHPDAVFEDEVDGGIFSGGAFVDDDGTVYFSYWALPGKGVGGIRIAYSEDRENHYTAWRKMDGYVVAHTNQNLIGIHERQENHDVLCCADPSNIWKNNGKYYLQAGNLCVLNLNRDNIHADSSLKGDWTDLYVSDNLKDWTFLHRFYERKKDNSWTDESEDNMCPSFLPLPLSPDGGKLSRKFLELFIAHNKGCQYYIGEYAEDHFYPEQHGRMSWNDITYFAPEALLDQNGRQIVWTWLHPMTDAQGFAHGFSGIFALPRTLWLNENGGLGIAPINELKKLRYKSHKSLNVFEVDCCEICLKIDMGNLKQAGIILYANNFGQEGLRIYYDKTQQKLIFDATNSVVNGIVEQAPLVLFPNEMLDLRIFCDRGVVEVFANERQAISRLYQRKNLNLKKSILFSEATITKKSLIIYDLMPSNMY